MTWPHETGPVEGRLFPQRAQEEISPHRDLQPLPSTAGDTTGWGSGGRPGRGTLPLGTPRARRGYRPSPSVSPREGHLRRALQETESEKLSRACRVSAETLMSPVFSPIRGHSWRLSSRWSEPLSPPPRARTCFLWEGHCDSIGPAGWSRMTSPSQHPNRIASADLALTPWGLLFGSTPQRSPYSVSMVVLIFYYFFRLSHALGLSFPDYKMTTYTNSQGQGPSRGNR